VCRPGLHEHLPRGVDPDHRRAGLGEDGGQVAGPTPEVQHPLVRAGREQIEQRLAVLVDERVVAVVRAGVPGLSAAFAGLVGSAGPAAGSLVCHLHARRRTDGP